MVELIDARPTSDCDSTRRARAASRAAAPGTDPDGHQAPAVDEPAASGLRAPRSPRHDGRDGAVGWLDFAGGLVEIGHGGDGFAFDNEGPRHRVWLEPFALATRLVTCGEYARLHRRRRIPAARALAVRRMGLRAASAAGRRRSTGTRDGAAGRVHARPGVRPMRPGEPVCHVSFYEAAAYAQVGRQAAADRSRVGDRGGDVARARQHARDGALHPRRRAARALSQMIGDVWEWTASPYVAYPGYRAAAGRDRRIQRQVHVQPDGAARRLRAQRRATISARPIGTSFRPTPAGCSAGFASRRTCDERFGAHARLCRNG